MNGQNDICLINIDEVEKSNRYDESHELVEKILDVDPVYTFFTSGSTGTPKGVIINNHNVIDYTDWAVKTFPINENTIMGNQSPFYFDISTQDIYTTLKTGATLGIIPPMYFAFRRKHFSLSMKGRSISCIGFHRRLYRLQIMIC